MDNCGLGKFALVLSVIAVGVSGYSCLKKCKCGDSASDLDSKIEAMVGDIISKKPDIIMEAMSKGVAQKREESIKQLGADVAASKDEISKLAMNFGPSSAKASVFAFIDPTCKHCIEFEKEFLKILDSKKDIGFKVVPVAVLGEDSVMIGKVYYALYSKSPEKALKFIKFVANSKNTLDKTAIEKGLKSIGADYDKDVEPNLSAADERLAKNGELAQKIGVPVVPAVFIVEGSKAEMLQNPTAEIIIDSVERMMTGAPKNAGGKPAGESLSEAKKLQTEEPKKGESK
ncbi:MAG: thioredoxin domain-containing protein [Holosporales bacterium]|nr:thioredoxin domain-containing protein [Holosporales bacterium]